MLAGLTEAERQQLLQFLATIRATIDSLDPDAVVAAALPRGNPDTADHDPLDPLIR